MASNIDQLETEVEVVLEHDKSIETLQEILAREQLEPVTYEEAKVLGYELMTFFEVFDEPVKQKSKDNGET
jgi:hypothetical protein